MANSIVPKLTKTLNSNDGLAVKYYRDFLDSEANKRLLAGLMKGVDGRNGEGLGVPGPKGKANQSFCAGMGTNERPWRGESASATLREVWEIGLHIQLLLGLDEPFDYAVIQIYKSAEGYKTGINSHIDKEQRSDMPIVGLSLYPDQDDHRPLTLSKGKERKQLELHDGSIYVLSPPTNSNWMHSLDKKEGTSVSITYRNHLTEAEAARLTSRAKLVQSKNPKTPGTLCRVTHNSCTCPAFTKTRSKNGRKRCKHVEEAFGK